MKPPPFEYVRPSSLDEALAALRGTAGEAKVLAGGQSLVPILNMRLASPSRLVDLNRVPELAYLEERDGGLAIGAMTRHRAVERDPRVARLVPLLAEAIRWIGHAAIRTRGTVGGSLAHADPAAELPAVALCLDARLTLHGPRGARQVPPDDFYQGYLSTALEPEEILTEVWLPAAPPGTGQAWLEFARRHGDFALVGVGVSLTLDGDTVGDVRVALTGVGGRPTRATETEGLLAGAPLDAGRLERAIRVLRESLSPDSDIHASADYRRHLAGVLAERALRLAQRRAQEAAALALDPRRTLGQQDSQA